MAKVIIKSKRLKEVHSKKTGVLYFVQEFGLESGHDFARAFDVLFDNANKALEPGEYKFADDAIYVDKNGRLAVDARRLVPLASQAARPAPAAVK